MFGIPGNWTFVIQFSLYDDKLYWLDVIQLVLGLTHTRVIYTGVINRLVIGHSFFLPNKATLFMSVVGKNKIGSHKDCR